MMVAALLAPLLISQPASAFQLSPPRTRSTLDGTLQFVNGGEKAFNCRVHIVLRTNEGKHAVPPEIEKIDINARGGACNGVHFADPFPWIVQATSASGGTISGGSWLYGGNSCPRPNNGFSINSTGVWTISPGCLSGTFQSNPPVTIIP
jgi:hypothetical protein